MAACSQSSLLTFKFVTHNILLSLGVDTGASVTLLSESAYLALREQLPNANLALQSTKVLLSSVQGFNLNILGTVTLPVTLAPSSEVFNVEFYVIKQFAMPCDGLLGLDSLIAHNLDVFPNKRALSRGNCFHYSMTDSAPLLSVASVDPRLATPTDPAPTLSPREEKRSSSSTRLVAAVLLGDQYIGPSSVVRLPVCLSDAPVGSQVLSLPDSMRIHRLSLESTLSTVRPDHVADALVTNTTGAPLTLKQGVHLGTYEVLDLPSFENLPFLSVAGVSTQRLDADFMDVVAQLSPHLKNMDYPGGKHALLEPTARHKPQRSLGGAGKSRDAKTID